MCVNVCVCVHTSWLKGGVVIGVGCCKKAQNIQMDSQICTRFSGKVGHEPKDNCFTVQAKWQKGGVSVGVACNRKVHNF